MRKRNLHRKAHAGAYAYIVVAMLMFSMSAVMFGPYSAQITGYAISDCQYDGTSVLKYRCACPGGGFASTNDPNNYACGSSTVSAVDSSPVEPPKSAVFSSGTTAQSVVLDSTQHNADGTRTYQGVTYAPRISGGTTTWVATTSTSQAPITTTDTLAGTESTPLTTHSYAIDRPGWFGSTANYFKIDLKTNEQGAIVSASVEDLRSSHNKNSMSSNYPSTYNFVDTNGNRDASSINLFNSFLSTQVYYANVNNKPELKNGFLTINTFEKYANTYVNPPSNERKMITTAVTPSDEQPKKTTTVTAEAEENEQKITSEDYTFQVPFTTGALFWKTEYRATIDMESGLMTLTKDGQSISYSELSKDAREKLETTFRDQGLDAFLPATQPVIEPAAALPETRNEDIAPTEVKGTIAQPVVSNSDDASKTSVVGQDSQADIVSAPTPEQDANTNEEIKIPDSLRPQLPSNPNAVTEAERNTFEQTGKIPDSLKPSLPSANTITLALGANLPNGNLELAMNVDSKGKLTYPGTANPAADLNKLGDRNGWPILLNDDIDTLPRLLNTLTNRIGPKGFVSDKSTLTINGQSIPLADYMSSSKRADCSGFFDCTKSLMFESSESVRAHNNNLLTQKVNAQLAATTLQIGDRILTDEGEVVIGKSSGSYSDEELESIIAGSKNTFSTFSENSFANNRITLTDEARPGTEILKTAQVHIDMPYSFNFVNKDTRDQYYDVYYSPSTGKIHAAQNVETKDSYSAQELQSRVTSQLGQEGASVLTHASQFNINALTQAVVVNAQNKRSVFGDLSSIKVDGTTYDKKSDISSLNSVPPCSQSLQSGWCQSSTGSNILINDWKRQQVADVISSDAAADTSTSTANTDSAATTSSTKDFTATRITNNIERSTNGQYYLVDVIGRTELKPIWVQGIGETTRTLAGFEVVGVPGAYYTSFGTSTSINPAVDFNVITVDSVLQASLLSQPEVSSAVGGSTGTSASSTNVLITDPTKLAKTGIAFLPSYLDFNVYKGTTVDQENNNVIAKVGNNEILYREGMMGTVIQSENGGLSWKESPIKISTGSNLRDSVDKYHSSSQSLMATSGQRALNSVSFSSSTATVSSDSSTQSATSISYNDLPSNIRAKFQQDTDKTYFLPDSGSPVGVESLTRDAKGNIKITLESGMVIKVAPISKEPTPETQSGSSTGTTNTIEKVQTINNIQVEFRNKFVQDEDGLWYKTDLGLVKVSSVKHDGLNIEITFSDGVKESVKADFLSTATSLIRSTSQYSGLGGYSFLFWSEKELSSWRNTVDEAFAKLYLGTDYIKSDLCAQHVDGKHEGIAFARTPQGLSELAAFVEATRSAGAFDENNRPIFIYRIEVSARNGLWDADPYALDPMKFNVELRGDRTVNLFKQQVALGKGKTFKRVGTTSIVQESNTFYRQICMIMEQKPSKWNIRGNALCSTIRDGVAGATSLSNTTSASTSGASSSSSSSEVNTI